MTKQSLAACLRGTPASCIPTIKGADWKGNRIVEKPSTWVINTASNANPLLSLICSAKGVSMAGTPGSVATMPVVKAVNESDK